MSNPIRWTAIHEKLGETPRDLDHDLITAAVAQHLPETDNLDWKRELPSKDGASEFAKDVAAMANTRGGLLVYGVSQDKDGRATAIAGVDVSEGSQRRLRQLAWNHMHPMVAGLVVLPLTSVEGQDPVLVLSVPRSADAPHMVERVGQKGYLAAPFRDGPETQFMRERDIERAYRDRFARHQEEGVRLTAMIDEACEQLDMKEKAWLVAAARPATPMPAVIRPLPRLEVETVLLTVLRRAAELAPSNRAAEFRLIRLLGSEVRDPRIGLRRWIVGYRSSYNPDAFVARILVELHHDGAVTFAVAIDGWYEAVPPDHHQVLCPLVEAFAVDLVSLVESYAQHLGGQSPVSFLVDLRRTDISRPCRAVDNWRHGGFIAANIEQVQGSSDVRRFKPVVGEVPMATDVDGLRATAKTLAADILHQFGVNRFTVLS